MAVPFLVLLQNEGLAKKKEICKISKKTKKCKVGKLYLGKYMIASRCLVNCKFVAICKFGKKYLQIWYSPPNPNYSLNAAYTEGNKYRRKIKHNTQFMKEFQTLYLKYLFC